MKKISIEFLMTAAIYSLQFLCSLGKEKKDKNTNKGTRKYAPMHH